MKREPLVLLPGMMCDARLYEPQVKTFSAQYQIKVMPLTGRTSIEEMAEDVMKEAPDRFALVGLSMGGIVAMEIIRQASRRVTRLALLDTNPFADTPDRKKSREQQINRVKAGELKSIMRDEMKPNYLADSKNKREILDLCMQMAEALGPQVFIEQSKALKLRRDQRETLKKVKVPTLIACGEYDSLCPIEKHRLMHKLVHGSRLCVIPGAGHLPTLEQPQLTNRKLDEWLKL
jgi:pimeloyl-ACP methyl ester carboxylesterase